MISSPSRITFGLLAVLALAFYTLLTSNPERSSNSSTTTAMPANNDGSSSPADSLKVSLSQKPSASSPPALTVTVKNTDDSKTMTFLRWNSPLDPLALALGLVSIVPAGADAPIPINPIQLRRRMPPSADDLVTLAPGESATADLELREPQVPADIWEAGAATVSMSGNWMAVWPDLTKEELVQDEAKLSELGQGEDAVTGNWEAPPVEVKT